MVQAKAPPLQVAHDPAAGALSGVDDEETPVPVSTVVDTMTNTGDDAEEPETPVLDTQVQAVATDLPQEEETPLHRAHRIPAGFVNVIFGKMRVRFDVTTPCPVANIARTLVPGMLLDGIVAELDGFLVGHDDILMGDLTSRDVFQSTIVFRPRGLRGGAPSERGEEAIRDMLSSLLQTKGLQGKALQTKLAEAFQKLSKAELVAWSQKGTWQALKMMVGTRITFLERQRRDKDPWTVSDPWSEALASSSTDPKKATSKPDSAPQISLIAEVWQNEDLTQPTVLERPSKGSTGISIMNPAEFNTTWSSESMPASPDELTVVVWPPSPEMCEDIPHENVVFPARVYSNSSSVTLLRGVAYHLGAKRITLRHEASNEFTTKRAVSLLVELEEELVDKPTWERISDKPMEFVQTTLGKSVNIMSTWGTRYWNKMGKISPPKEACRVTTNVLVEPEVLHQVLKTSGTSWWISPRQGQEVYHDFRPLWIRGSLADCRRKHDTLMHATGIIKGQKGFAVRIPTEHLDEAKKVLYPGQSLQPTLDPKEIVQMYKVSPTPVGATQEDVSSFLRRALPMYTIQVRRQVGPTSWLIAVNGTIDKDFVPMKEGHLVLQPWRSGRNVDSFRQAVLVGNPKVLRRASEAVTFAGAIPPGDVVESLPNPRPPPQGPVQQLVTESKRETEDRFTALFLEHKKQTEGKIEALQKKMEESKAKNDEAIAELRTSQQGHQEALERVEQSGRVQSKALETQMADQFATLLREIRGMKGVPEGKRSPAPSPDASEPSKSLKTS